MGRGNGLGKPLFMLALVCYNQPMEEEKHLRRFFADHVPEAGAAFVLEGPEARHMGEVLRLKPGGQVELLDGAGGRFLARIEAVDPRGVELEVLKRRQVVETGGSVLDAVQGFLKGKKMDALVRQASELGVGRFYPWMPRRSVARPDPGRMAGRVERWERIALESAKQCGRAIPLEIGPCLETLEVCALAGGYARAVVFWEENPDHLLPPGPWGLPAPGRVLAVTGPEGGIDAQEARQMMESGFHSAGLGPRVLKAETAAPASWALLQYLAGDMGPKAVG